MMTDLESQSPIVENKFQQHKNHDFEEGTRVEVRYRGRDKYYPGIISRVRVDDGTYDIDYDDGEKEHRVKREFIKPIGGEADDDDDDDDVDGELKKGTRVEARYKGRPKYYPGIISRVRVDDGTYDIDYDDGEKEIRVKREFIKPIGGSKTDDDDVDGELKEGTRVEARYRGQAKYFPGVISRVRLDGTYDIDYDDSEKENRVKREFIKPIGKSYFLHESNLVPGKLVEAQYGGTEWTKGVITKVNQDGTYDIDYENGKHILCSFSSRVLIP